MQDIIVAPLHGRAGHRSPAAGLPLPEAGLPAAPVPAAPRTFTIRSADHPVLRESANSLLRDRYAWRGYHTVSLPADQTTNRITLSAAEGERTIGTITVVLDGPEGIAAADAFGPEVEALRAAGERLVEFTKLAIDPISESQCVLAALFHVAYLVAHRLRGHDRVLLEVNPRHVRFYRRMLGAEVLAGERPNAKVNAPAVLLGISFAHIREQIARFGGHPEAAGEERSLYPYAFSAREEEGILARMMQAQRPVSTALN
jgi:hypothetical protein